jgi:hypothetical protein
MSSNIKDKHTNKAQVINTPITGAFVITPSDTTDLPQVTLSIYIGQAGAFKATMMDGSIVTYPHLAIGRHPLRVKRVWDVASKADLIVGEV